MICVIVVFAGKLGMLYKAAAVLLAAAAAAVHRLRHYPMKELAGSIPLALISVLCAWMLFAAE